MTTLRIPMEEYLAMPRVSSGVLVELLTRCPAAARYTSYLNPNRPAQPHEEPRALGTIAHSILLEGNTERIEVIDPNKYPARTTGAIPNGWTNASIRGARDAAIAAGRIPVLAGDMDEIVAIAASARRFVDGLRITEPAIWRAFEPDGGLSELTITWDDDGVPCRIRTDRLSEDYRIVVDAKFTARSAEPDRWSRTHVFGESYYVNAAFYRRGIRAEVGVEPTYVYLVVECEPPYLCSLVGMDPATCALGDRKVEAALRAWRRCVETDVWPEYPYRVAYAELPPYEEARWQQDEARGDWRALFPDLAEALR